MSESKTQAPFLGILLAPFGSGKSTHHKFFTRRVASWSEQNATFLCIDNFVFAHSAYREALVRVKAGTDNANVLHTVARSVDKTARRRHDKELDALLAARTPLVIEEPARTEQWSAWFAENTLARARRGGYRVALLYLAVAPDAAYHRCRERRAHPVIARPEFDRCCRASLAAFADLAGRADIVEIYTNNEFRSRDRHTAKPTLVCSSQAGWINGWSRKLLAEVVQPATRAADDHFRAAVNTTLAKKAGIAAHRFAGRGCWITLVMRGDRYVDGALALGQSLRRAGTRFDTLCMVADRVSDGARARLARVFTRVSSVPNISHAARRLPGQKQHVRYDDFFVSHAFTKWNCLGFTEYDKVAFVDADVVFQATAEKLDRLFDLPTPAGTFSNPWCSTPKGSVYSRLVHGAPVSSAEIRRALSRRTGYVAFGSLILLQPDAGALATMYRILASAETYAQTLKTTSGTDELLLAELYLELGQDWTHVDPRYHLIPWKEYGRLGKVRLEDAWGIHYFGAEKPWEMARGAWPDLAIWWAVWDTLPADVKAPE
uniref:Zeta toxin domain-containing protein n=1 Tax=Marseillevirus LCMAC103 TaxID=2506604 RepID=A0A481YV15_9VIRU|nr:MAG: uncharacterized protein LCMAC103_03460 [Marseillevirus LCMAC103]